MTIFDEAILLPYRLQGIFRSPDTFYVTVSLYMLFPLPAVLTLHLISCSFWSFYIRQIFTHFLSLGSTIFCETFPDLSRRANSYSSTKTNTSCCTVHASGLALMTSICDYTELKYFPLNDWIIQGNPLFIFVSSEIYIALCTWRALNKHIWII